MLKRLFPCLLALAMAWAGCATPKKPKDTKKPKATPAPKTIADMSADPSFGSFLGRLRIAVQKRDRPMLSTMLAPDFGWRWDEAPAGETAFDYWDKNELWPELDKLMSQKFTPHESYMVSPPAFASDPAYRGYRCGIRQVNGSWRLAYFITGEDALQ